MDANALLMFLLEWRQIFPQEGKEHYFYHALHWKPPLLERAHVRAIEENPAFAAAQLWPTPFKCGEQKQAVQHHLCMNNKDFFYVGEPWLIASVILLSHWQQLVRYSQRPIKARIHERLTGRNQRLYAIYLAVKTQQLYTCSHRFLPTLVPNIIYPFMFHFLR